MVKLKRIFILVTLLVLHVGSVLPEKGKFKLDDFIDLTRFFGINYGDPLLRPKYDYVIVGAGPAGSVLANRLSENPKVTVLVLEAGKSELPLVTNVPLTTAFLQATDYNFGYQSEVQKFGCQGLRDRKCNWPHGKGVGGSTIINSMIYTRGGQRDYDGWALAGNPGWSWTEMLPYHVKVERENVRDFGNNGFHGKNGSVAVEDCPFR